MINDDSRSFKSVFWYTPVLSGVQTCITIFHPTSNALVALKWHNQTMKYIDKGTNFCIHEGRGIIHNALLLEIDLSTGDRESLDNTLVIDWLLREEEE